MLKEQQIKVVIVPSDNEAYVSVIENSLESMQKIVGGLIGIIETEFKLNEQVFDYVYCDSGKMDNYAPSRAIYIRDEKPGDIIFSDFFVSKVNEDLDRISLTDEECEFILKEMNDPIRNPWPYIYKILGVSIVDDQVVLADAKDLIND